MIKELLQGKKAVLFDLDGTLVDSMWMWLQIDIEYLARYGYECPDDLQHAIAGMSFSETAVYFKERFQIPDSPEEIKECWIRMSIDKYRHEVPFKDGAFEFLCYCRDHQIRTGIATSNDREIVDALMESLNMDPYLDVVVTACEVKAGKPAPDVYLEAAKRLNTKPEECLVFEDITAGILAGKRAGMTVIAVEDAFSREMKEEKRALADGFIDTYFELL